METTKNKAKRPPAQKKPQPKKKVALDERQQPQASQKRRVPGAAVKQPPQKAPHAKPRKNAPVQEPVRVTPEVVYLAPKPFSRNRLLLRLATVVAVVLALVVGLSLFFKVENIQVSGCEQYTAYQIQQASGISEGDQLLTFSRAKASGKIISALPYVKEARVGIKLPGTVYIEIKELDMTYAIQARDGSWWLIAADGRVIEQIENTASSGYTRILGVQADGPRADQKVQAAEPRTETETVPEGNAQGETLPTVAQITGAQKLDVVLTILESLEENSIIGLIEYIDVSNLNNITMEYGQRLDIVLGTSENLPYKITYMAQAISQLAEYETGELDVSFKYSEKALLNPST